MTPSLKNLYQIRGEIDALQSRIAEIDSAALPVADVALRVAAFVADLGARFDVGHLGRAIVSADTFTVSDIRNAAFSNEPGETELVIQAWLDPDRLTDRLLDAAAPFAEKKGTAMAERPALLRKLDDQLHDLLVAEEEMVVALEQQGIEVYRRPGIDPYIILGVAA